MPSRRSFKTDESFLGKLSIGAIASRGWKSAIRHLKSETWQSVALDLLAGCNTTGSMVAGSS